jgi:hypothetical protein
MDDHAPKNTNAQHPHNQQSRGSWVCLLKKRQENKLVYSCGVGNTQSTPQSTISRNNFVWQTHAV